jgi:hypothetical protein
VTVVPTDTNSRPPALRRSGRCSAGAPTSVAATVAVHGGRCHWFRRVGGHRGHDGSRTAGPSPRRSRCAPRRCPDRPCPGLNARDHVAGRRRRDLRRSRPRPPGDRRCSPRTPSHRMRVLRPGRGSVDAPLDWVVGRLR